MGNGWMTITDVASKIRVTPKTIIRWEKSGKVNRPKRDWRGWRVYGKDDLRRLREFKDTIIYFEEGENGENNNPNSNNNE